jgi:UDP-N-acetylglucosamine transferase subunit ALG13
MIIATLGTHPAPMDRLVSALDKIAQGKEDIFIQAASFNLLPKKAKILPLMGFEEYKTHLEMADFIICHGAAATIHSILKTIGKTPLVVPRRQRYGEHVDDHQVKFAEFMSKKYGLPHILEMKDLAEGIETARNRKITLNLPDTLGDLCSRLKDYTNANLGPFPEWLTSNNT